LKSLCVGCGMCCDGTMYKSVDVEVGDQLPLLEAEGIALYTEEKFTFFRQPCTAFDTDRCKIYESRPTVCREYRCLLLRRLDAGEANPADAVALVARTTALRDRVRSGLMAFLETAERVPLGELYRRMLSKLDAASDPEAARREASELLFDVVALRVILAREFEPRDASSHTADVLTEP